MNTQRDFVRPNNLIDKIVLIDGVGRSGKLLMGLILASMKNVEKARIDYLFDIIPRMYAMDKLSHDAAVTILKLEADRLLYYTRMSRSVNFRPTDYTSIFKDPYPLRYILRLSSEEGEPVVERILREKPIFQDAMHDGLGRADIFFDAFGDKLYMIEMLRDPVSVVYSWSVRNFGSRIGNDPRELGLTIGWKDTAVPYQALGWEDEYLRIKPMERIIRMIDIIVRGNIEGYNRLGKKNKQRVMFVVLDKFVVNPMPYCKKIAGFVGTEITSVTEHKLMQERCPRVVDPDELVRKKKFIDSQVSGKYRKMLDGLTCHYETFKMSLGDC